jgi:adenylylsulfate reductase subunit A
VLTETVEGRGPVYIDCRHLPEDDVNRLKSTLGIDRPAMPTFFEQKGIDLATDLLEITVSEMSSRGGGVVLRRAGVRIDTECLSNVPGLFAAGDCSTICSGIAGATVMGHIAGESAGKYALSRPAPQPPDPGEIDRLHETIVRPLELKSELSARKFEDEVRTIMTSYVGFRRNETRLKEALKRLKGLEGKESGIAAKNFHDLMRIYEARNIRAVAETIAASAIDRRETRGGAAHVREDYPERDDASGLRTILVQKDRGADGLRVTSQPTGLKPEVTPAPATK